MNTRFWQRTYLFTLVLFLICLNVSIFTLAYYTYQNNVTATEENCRAEQAYILRSFERDYADMMDESEAFSPSLLMQSYGTYYAPRGVGLRFLQNTDVLYNNLPEDLEFPSLETLSHREGNGVRYIVISAEICEGTYILQYGKNIQELEDGFRHMMLTFVVAAVVVSVVLAVVLLLLLRKLSAPLEQLRETTERVAGGDLSIRVSGGKREDEFVALANSFNVMIDRMEAQMGELERHATRNQQLVDNMAHEIRTPLTAIRGYAEYIQKAVLSEEEKIDAAMYILSEATRLQRISQKLLDMAVLRNETITKEPLNMRMLADQVCQQLFPVAQEKQIKLVANGRDVIVPGDEVLAGMLLYNLAENGMKASSPGGEVHLCCVQEGDVSKVVVRDYGKGMTEAQLQRITEPFYRTDKSRSRAEGGAGLGLALCAQIVEMHGWKMHFTSQPEEGTQVELILTT